jgi:hypothetical protein
VSEELERSRQSHDIALWQDVICEGFAQGVPLSCTPFTHGFLILAAECEAPAALAKLPVWSQRISLVFGLESQDPGVQQKDLK